MPYAYLILPAIVGCGLIFGWTLARWLEKRYDRGNQASSDEILDELEMAYTPRRSIEIRTRPENLPRVFECILENIDSGLGGRHIRRLLSRIQAQPRCSMRNAMFPVKVNGIRTDLDIQWSRDAENRVRLLVLAVPKIIRALKQQSKRDRPAYPRELDGGFESGIREAAWSISQAAPPSQRPATERPLAAAGKAMEVSAGGSLPPVSPA